MADTVLIDPLGRRVVLHDFTWVRHILIRHPEMRPHRHLAEEAVRNPLAIRCSRVDADCRTYYGRGPRAGIMVAVIANVKAGFVKTAFLTTRKKGICEWSPSKP